MGLLAEQPRDGSRSFFLFLILTTALPTIYFGLGVINHGTERHDSGSTELGSASSYNHNPSGFWPLGKSRDPRFLWLGACYTDPLFLHRTRRFNLCCRITDSGGNGSPPVLLVDDHQVERLDGYFDDSKSLRSMNEESHHSISSNLRQHLVDRVWTEGSSVV